MEGWMAMVGVAVSLWGWIIYLWGSLLYPRSVCVKLVGLGSFLTLVGVFVLIAFVFPEDTMRFGG